MLAADTGFVDAGLEIAPVAAAAADVSEPAVDVETLPVDPVIDPTPTREPQTGEPQVDPVGEFVPVIIVCPGVPELPTIDLIEPKNGYLDEYKRFLTQNPDWLAEHGADGIQLCVMTPSRYVDGVELSNPGEARAFDAWFEQQHPWYFFEQVGSEQTVIREDAPSEGGDSPIVTDEPTLIDERPVLEEVAPESSGSGALEISYNLVLSRPTFDFGSAVFCGGLIAPVASESADDASLGVDAGTTLSGVSFLSGLDLLSLDPRRFDFPSTVLVLGCEIVQRSVVDVEVEAPVIYVSAPVVDVEAPAADPVLAASPTAAVIAAEPRLVASSTSFTDRQSAFARFAAATVGSSSFGSGGAPESTSGGSGRRRARA